jgi:hypothetical protein
MPSQSLSKTVVAVKEQVSCDLDGKTVILGLKTGSYYGLNTTGSFIWTLLQNPIKIREIRDRILEAFEVDGERCERDLLDLLKGLLAKGLVEFGD